MTDQPNPLPPLPEPDTLDWCNGEDAPESAFSKEALIEYGQVCAAHARKAEREALAEHFDTLSGYEAFGPTIADYIRKMK